MLTLLSQNCLPFTATRKRFNEQHSRLLCVFVLDCCCGCARRSYAWRIMPFFFPINVSHHPGCKIILHYLLELLLPTKRRMLERCLDLRFRVVCSSRGEVMKEGIHPYVPPVSHTRDGSIEVSLNPQASEFIPSGISGSAGRAAVSATATARRVALSQDCRLGAPAPSTKQSRKRSTAGERNSRQHGRAGRREGPSRNADLRVLNGAAINESASAVAIAMRALGTNTCTTSSASFGTNAGAALEKPERRRGGRNASTRNKNAINEGIVAKQASGGRTRQGRDTPAEQERILGGYDGDAPGSVHSPATSTPITAAAGAVASPAMPHRRPSSSTIDRRKSAASRWVHRRTEWCPREKSLAAKRACLQQIYFEFSSICGRLEQIK